MDKRSVSVQILDVLEDAGEPMFLKDIRDALDGGYDSPYVMARIANLRKRQLVKVDKVTVKTKSSERDLQVYSLV